MINKSLIKEEENLVGFLKVLEYLVLLGYLLELTESKVTQNA